MHIGEHIYDVEHCTRLSRRIGVLLARGNINGARHSLEAAWLELTGAGALSILDRPITELLPTREANLLEQHLGAAFLRNLCGVPIEDIRNVPYFGVKALADLQTALMELGVPLPVPPEEELEAMFDMNEPLDAIAHPADSTGVSVLELLGGLA